MTTQKPKIVGLRAAAHDFNEWIGPAIIYYNPDTGFVYTSIFSDSGSYNLIEEWDPTIILHRKSSLWENNNRITMKEIKQKIYDLTE